MLLEVQYVLETCGRDDNYLRCLLSKKGFDTASSIVVSFNLRLKLIIPNIERKSRRQRRLLAFEI